MSTPTPLALDNAAMATILAALWHYRVTGMGSPENRDPRLQEIACGRPPGAPVAGACTPLDTQGVAKLFDTLRATAHTPQVLVSRADFERTSALSVEATR